MRLWTGLKKKKSKKSSAVFTFQNTMKSKRCFREAADYKKGLEDMLSLGYFLTKEANLPFKESEKNILDNVVSVNSLGRTKGTLNCGSGLMITKTGFVITAYHVVSDFIHEWNTAMTNAEDYSRTYLRNLKENCYITTQRNGDYSIDPTFCFYSSLFDTALIKAQIYEKPEPIKFNIAKTDLQYGEEVKLYTYTHEQFRRRMGKVMFQYYPCPTIVKVNTFLTNASGALGFSGAPFVNSSGELSGMALYILRDKGKTTGDTGGIKISHIIAFAKLCFLDLASGL